MTIQLVPCSNCTGVWLVEDLRTKNTVKCALCHTTHDTSKLSIRYETDNRTDAAEARAQLLAQNADRETIYQRHKAEYGPFGEQADAVENRHNKREQVLADEASDAFADWDNLYADDAESVFEDRDRRLEDEAWNALSEIHNRFEAEAERAFEEQDTRLAGEITLDHDYSVVETTPAEELGEAGEVSLTRQLPAHDAATATLDNPVSDLAATIADETRDELVAAIRDLADGRTALELQAVLHDADVVADDANLLGLAARTARGDRQAAWEFTAVLAETGGRTTTSTSTLPARVFALTDQTPTIAIHLNDGFWTLRRSQREAICKYLSALAQGCDLRVVSSGIEQRRLVDDHRTDLPVSRDDITRPDAHRDQRVEEAAETLAPDSREVHVLRVLADEHAKTLSYQALDSTLTVSKSRRSQLLSALTDLDLVDTFGPRTDKYAELLPAGRQFIDELDSETTRQRTLAESVSDVCNQSDNSRVITRTHGEAGTGGGRTRHRLPALHTAQPLPRWDAAATAASTPKHGISIVDYPLQEQQDRGSPRRFYDRDRLVVGAEYSNPMQYWVCVARALASRWTFSTVLDGGDRIDDTDDLAEFLAEHKHLLRDSTCLGYLPDDVEDGADYLAELQSAEENLCELTQDLTTGEFDASSESEFRSTITKDALGLAKTMLDLLDLVGVDVVQQVRLPTAANNSRHEMLAETDRPALVKSLITAVKLQARAGRSSIYRQLFETDDDRRDAAIEPAVDAFDVGEMVGSICVVGDLGSAETDLVREVRGRLNALDEDLHEDAPNISVRVEVAATEDIDRTAFAQAVERMAAAKNLSMSRDAVSTLRLFVGTPFDAARAIHALSSEDERRQLRLSEVREGLTRLAAARILPWESRGVSKLTAALLAADRSLSGSEVADRAEVSRSTWANHRDWLDAVGLITHSEQGWRLTLAFNTDAERYSGESFWFVKSSEDALPYPVLLSSLGMQVAMSLIDDESTREQVVSEIQRGWTTDPDVLEERWPRITPWLDVLQSVVGGNSKTPEPVVFGHPDQANLQQASLGGASA